jgi:tetratricopeptide (TPR) repeat protein
MLRLDLLFVLCLWGISAVGQTNIKAEAYYYSGVEKLNVNGDAAGAIKDFDKAIKLRPDYTEAFFFRGKAYNKLSNYSKAITEFSKAIELNPKYYEAYIERADLKMAYFEDKRGAEEDLKKAIGLRPDITDAYEKLGYLKYLQKIYYDAISYYNKCIERDTSNIDFFLMRADAKAKQGLYDDATFDFDHAIALNKNELAPHYKKATMFYDLGKFDDAILEYNLIIEIQDLTPGSFFPEPFYYKGMAKFKMRDIQGACETWKQLKKMCDDRFTRFMNVEDLVNQNCKN